MPNQDGSLTGADRITLVRMLDRMIPVEDPALAAGTLGLLSEVENRANADKSSSSAFMRVTEAVSLDLMSHAVGGFSALTEQEQFEGLLGIERALPAEFALVLETVRDVYYEDERTPKRPSTFDSDSEMFGKVPVEIEEVSDKPRRALTLNRSKGAIS